MIWYSSFHKRTKQLLTTFVKTQFRALLATIGVDLAANLFWLVLSLVLAQTYTQIFGMNSARGQILQQLGMDVSWAISGWLILLLVLILGKALLDYLKFRWRGKLGAEFTFLVRTNLFQHHLQLSYRQYEEKGSDRYLLRFSGDLSSLQSLMTTGVLRFLSDLSMVLMGIGLISILAPFVGGILSSILLLLGILVWFINHRIGILEGSRRNGKSSLLAFVNNRISHIATLKAFNKLTPEANRFTRKAEKLRQLDGSYHHWAALQKAIVPMLVLLAIAAILFMVNEVTKFRAELDSAQLFVVVLILLSWRTVLGRLFRVGLVWKKGFISLGKLDKLLASPINQQLEFVEKPIRRGTLYIESPSIGPKSPPLLEHLYLELPMGAWQVLEGPTGSGKTTLVKILTGLYPLQEGRIEVGNQAIQGIHPKVWRKQFAFLSKTYPLYGYSIKEAICYSRRNWEKAALVFREWQQHFPCLKELPFDQSLKGGLGQLSTSQVLLLSWLRVFLTQKPIWVLDEPFRGLSPEQQMKLVQFLESNKKRPTILMLTSEINQLPPGISFEVVQVSSEPKART